jgi:glutamate dehydrogenase (NAD(P)+)
MPYDPGDPIFSDSLFQMAKRQFEIIADHLGIAEGDRERIIYPKRAVSVALPIHRDDGTIDVFHGYRVQHHLAVGPTKGGTRFAPAAYDRPVRRARRLDELEVRLGGASLRRSQGRSAG